MFHTMEEHFAEKMNAFMRKAEQGQNVKHLASWYLQCLKRGDWEGLTDKSRKEYLKILSSHATP